MVLVPEQTPAELEGTDLFRLSSLGFAPDGTLQAIFQLSDEIVPTDEITVLGHDNGLLFDAYVDGEQVGGDIHVYAPFTWNGKNYLGCGHEVPLEYKDRVTLSKAGGTLLTQAAFEPLEGPWTISFPVENIPVKEVELTGAIGEQSLPTTFAISHWGPL